MNATVPYTIYLINLARSGERLAAMRSKFADLGLAFERIDAVDGRLMSAEERREFASQRQRANGWLPGAIGCFQSHYRAWTAISEGDAPFGVVFEDDVHIGATLPALLADVGAAMGNRMDIVRLEATRHLLLLDPADSVAVAGSRLTRVNSESWGAGAYILPKAVAKLLLLEPPRHHSPVDFFLFDKGTSVVARRHRVYQAVPALCVQSKFDVQQAQPDTNYTSNIEHNSEDGRLRHLLRKMAWKLRGLRNLILGYRRVKLSEDILRL